jgi:hypothetical protein
MYGGISQNKRNKRSKQEPVACERRHEKGKRAAGSLKGQEGMAKGAARR